jgi:organic radical activating enzyme
MTCLFCLRKGHLESICYQKHGPPKHVKHVEDVIWTIKRPKVPCFTQHVYLDGVKVPFEVDTGSHDTFCSEDVWKQLGEPKIQPTDTNFKSATGHRLPVLGIFKTKAKLDQGTENECDLQVYVSSLPNLNLLGRDACMQLRVNFNKLASAVSPINSVKADTTIQLQHACQELCKEFPDLFKHELGCLKDFELEIKFTPESKPVFHKPRRVPFALLEDLNAALDSGITRGVWQPIHFNCYGTPVVPVRKATLSDQSRPALRVCGDYSVSVNSLLEPHRHPLPLPEDLMRKLAGGCYFSKIDLADAYNQIRLGPESQKKLALSTHRGVLLQLRLPFGIKSAPGYFQEIMDQLTCDLQGTAVFLDDILVSGANPEEHLQNLRALLQRLHDNGLRCKLEKCVFAQPSVDYLGHTLSTEGISKGPKVDAIVKMPPPKDVSSLRSFLGSTQFYGKFLPNLSTITEPLHRLTKKNVKWTWQAEQQTAFQKLKDLLCSDSVLAHYDPSMEIGIACDASEVGIGAVLFHRYTDGSERPIANVSKTLTSAQRKYSQIQKEALAIVFALKKISPISLWPKLHSGERPQASSRNFRSQ